VAQVERTVAAAPDRVWAVLADGWTYSDWVVGTTHIRDVDPHWPRPGARIHHKTGPWPVSLHDRTLAVAAQAPRMLHLRPRLGPLGEVDVHITLTAAGPDRTRVTLAEEFRAGPLRWVRNRLNDLALHGRNRESLRRLADLVEHRTS
jgi:Polyketide cyclase / dehydrase and lipid transport